VVANPTNLPLTHRHRYVGVGKVVNQSIRGLLGRPPFYASGTIPWLLLALAVLAVGVLVTFRLLSQRRDLLAFVTLSLTTVLVSPVSWVHYWVFVALAPFVALLEWRRDRVLSVASIILTVAMCADLEDPRLEGPFSLGRKFSKTTPAVLFGIRNLYVLAGLVFLAIVAWRILLSPSAETATRSSTALSGATP
jgi:Glycosyltransferase family 87